MPPKEKKSKKQKEAEKKAEQERLEEEKRIADIAEAERLEKLRIKEEEQEKIRLLEEARLQGELDERLTKEDVANADVYQDRKSALNRELRAATQDDEWNRSPVPCALTHVSRIAELRRVWLQVRGM